MDISNLTDKDILELTNIKFSTSDGKSVFIPLDDVRIIDGVSVDVSGTLYKFKEDEINKIVVKKGKYNLMKGGVDFNSINEYINKVVVDTTGKLMEQYATTLQLNAGTLEQSVNEIKQTLEKANIVINDVKRGHDEVQKSHTKLETSVESVMKELKVLIEE